jgi:hypothetical protein
MQKTYFHKSKLSQTARADIKNIVDINILLNRVKIEKKNEIKRKIIFFSLITLAVTLFGFFTVILK